MNNKSDSEIIKRISKTAHRSLTEATAGEEPNATPRAPSGSDLDESCSGEVAIEGERF